MIRYEIITWNVWDNLWDKVWFTGRYKVQTEYPVGTGIYSEPAYINLVTTKGCTDPNAVNYNPDIEAYHACCCCWDIVGDWTGSSTVIDSVYTVSYMGEIIDSLSLTKNFKLSS